MRFSDIPAHDSVKERLTAMVDNNRIPHAILLKGPSGVGKFMLARALAQYIHCENRHDGDSCGVCPSCRQHQSFNHIDTIFSFPVIKGKLERPTSDDYIDEWREFLTAYPYMDFAQWQMALGKPDMKPIFYVHESQALIKKLMYTAHSATYKVVIMWLPERMNEESANKLLKLIEEPYSDTIFILVSNRPGEILPTIYSRVQRIDVNPLSDEVVARYLTDRFAVDPTEALSVAHIAQGSILEAENQLNLSSEHETFLSLFKTLMRKAYVRDVAGLRAWSIEVSELGREGCARFLSYCERLIRENFIYNLNVGNLNYMNQQEAEFSVKFARFINHANAEQIIAQLDTAASDILTNANSKIVLFDLAVSMIILIKAGVAKS